MYIVLSIKCYLVFSCNILITKSSSRSIQFQKILYIFKLQHLLNFKLSLTNCCLYLHETPFLLSVLELLKASRKCHCVSKKNDFNFLYICLRKQPFLTNDNSKYIRTFFKLKCFEIGWDLLYFDLLFRQNFMDNYDALNRTS